MINLLISALVQVCAFSLVPFIGWLVTGRKENFFKWIGLKKPQWNGKTSKVCLSTVCAAVIYSLVMFFVMNQFMAGVETATSQFNGMGLAAIPSVLIYALIQTSLSEEIFFRGFLGKRLINKFGFVVGNSIQAICFGLLHGVPFFMATNNVAVLILVTLLPTAVGFFMGYLNEKMSEGSIIPSWITHGLLNILSALVSSL